MQYESNGLTTDPIAFEKLLYRLFENFHSIIKYRGNLLKLKKLKLFIFAQTIEFLKVLAARCSVRNNKIDLYVF